MDNNLIIIIGYSLDIHSLHAGAIWCIYSWPSCPVSAWFPAETASFSLGLSHGQVNEGSLEGSKFLGPGSVAENHAMRPVQYVSQSSKIATFRSRWNLDLQALSSKSPQSIIIEQAIFVSRSATCRHLPVRSRLFLLVEDEIDISHLLPACWVDFHGCSK